MYSIFDLRLDFLVILHFDVFLDLSYGLLKFVALYFLTTFHILILLFKLFYVASVQSFVLAKHR